MELLTQGGGRVGLLTKIGINSTTLRGDDIKTARLAPSTPGLVDFLTGAWD